MQVEIEVPAARGVAAAVSAAGRRFGVCEPGGQVPAAVTGGLSGVLTALSQAETALTGHGAGRCRTLAQAVEQGVDEVVAADRAGS